MYSWSSIGTGDHPCTVLPRVTPQLVQEGAEEVLLGVGAPVPPAGQPDTAVCGTGDLCSSHGLPWPPWVLVRSEPALPPLFQNISASVELNESA